jgi:hypothetical protein
MWNLFLHGGSGDNGGSAGDDDVLNDASGQEKLTGFNDSSSVHVMVTVVTIMEVVEGKGRYNVGW